jgi:hypothetical protein
MLFKKDQERAELKFIEDSQYNNIELKCMTAASIMQYLLFKFSLIYKIK